MASLFNNILNAINEGIKTGLMSFDDNDGFEKTSKISSKSANSIVTAEKLSNAISEWSCFVCPSFCNARTNKCERNLSVDINGNNIDVKMASTLRKNEAPSISIFSIDIINGNELIFNIDMLTQLGGVNQYFEKIMSDLKQIKQTVDVSINTINFTILTYTSDNRVYVRFYLEDFYNNKQILPQYLNIIGSSESAIINNKIQISLTSSQINGKLGLDDGQFIIDYFRKQDINWIFIEPGIVSDMTYQNNLYYDYDLPGLDDKVLYQYKMPLSFKYRGEIEHKAIYGANDNVVKINKNLSRIADTCLNKISKYAEENKPALAEAYIKRLIVYFAFLLDRQKIPFYRSMQEDPHINYRVGTSYIVYGILISFIHAFNLKMFTNYTFDELLDMIDATCRFVQKYGGVHACELYEETQKKGK